MTTTIVLGTMTLTYWTCVALARSDCITWLIQGVTGLRGLLYAVLSGVLRTAVWEPISAYTASESQDRGFEPGAACWYGA